MRLSVSILLSLLLAGCVVTVFLEDQQFDPGPGADDDDSAPGEPCVIPVPDGVTLTVPVHGKTQFRFYVPTASAALGALHASRRLERLEEQSIDLRLSPSYFFATALQASFLGCSDAFEPDPRDPSNAYPRDTDADAAGCLDLRENTVWVELCRMYPEDLPCPDGYADVVPSTDQAATGQDNVANGMLAWGMYSVYAYAMLAWEGGGDLEDPDAWVAAASDDLAIEKLLALMHVQTPFYAPMAALLADCTDSPIEDCIEDEWLSDQVAMVGGLTASLERGAEVGRCYDGDLTVADVREYVAAIQPLFPGASWDAVASRAEGALRAAAQGERGSFQSVADIVLNAIDDEAGLGLRGPGVGLSAEFGLDCPP